MKSHKNINKFKIKSSNQHYQTLTKLRPHNNFWINKKIIENYNNIKKSKSNARNNNTNNDENEYFNKNIKKEIKHLDKWYLDKKLNKEVPFTSIYNDLGKKNKNQEPKDLFDDKKNLTPNINTKMIDLILLDNENYFRLNKEKDEENMLNNNLKNFLKGNESILLDMNKRLISDLIISKTKKLLKENLKINKIYNINEIVKNVTFDLISKFKNLKNIFHKGNEFNNEEYIIKEIKEAIIKTQKILLNENYEIKNENLNFETYESNLLNKLNSNNKEIWNKKLKVNSIREKLQNKIKDLKNKNIKFKELEKKYYNKIKNFKKEEEEDNFLIDEDGINRTKIQIKNWLSDNFQKFQREIAVLQEDIENYEREIYEDKVKNLIIVYKLKDIYYKFLKDPLVIIKQNKTLSTIVQSINNLGKDEFKKDNFPEILDDKNINYVLKIAKLENLLEKKKKDINDFTIKNKNNPIHCRKIGEILGQPLNSMIKGINEKLKLKKNNLKIEKLKIISLGRNKGYKKVWKEIKDNMNSYKNIPSSKFINNNVNINISKNRNNENKLIEEYFNKFRVNWKI